MYKKSAIRALAASCILALAMATPSFASEGGEAKPKDGPLYVDFKNIVVPVIKRNGQTGVVALSLSAQVQDVGDQTKVMDHVPRLRDAFIRTLYGNLDTNQLMREDGMLDIPMIKERLLKTAALVMKDKESNPIKDILFQNIAQQTY